MSDDERDIDIESDDDGDSDGMKDGDSSKSGAVSQYSTQAEKRAHHNALERKRRDHIKDSFTALRDAVPSLQGEKVASRAQILKKAAEYITFMKRKNQNHQQDNEDLKRQNNHLDQQIRQLERQLTSGCDNDMVGIKTDQHSSESEMSDMDDEESPVDIVTTASQSNVFRKTNGSAVTASAATPVSVNRKVKATAYNSKVMYQ